MSGRGDAHQRSAHRWRNRPSDAARTVLLGLVSSSARLALLSLPLLVLPLLPTTATAAPAVAKRAARAPAIDATDIVIPDEVHVLDGLRTEHPRLVLTPASVVALQQKIATDPTTATMYAAVRARANALLAVPPVSVTTNGQEGMLQVSQEALRRLHDLGLVWLVEHDPVIASRAWDELQAVTGFADWNPLHFLDTAEMTHAVAIGYDWLYDAFTPTQRTTLVDAIVQKGLTPAADAYSGKIPLLLATWVIADHNWNNVVNGGITIGALAVGDVEPALASFVAHEALTRLPAALAHYAPDGGWPEGVSYWLYATEYTVATISSLESALGHDFGFSTVAGLDRTGDVPLFMTGPTGQRWNWADDGEPRFAPAAPPMFWLADRFGRVAYRDYQLAHAQPAAEDVIWYEPSNAPVEVLPLDHLFTGVDVATMRSAWGDAGALWVGTKGGLGGFNHNQLDLGSFVLESQHERFAIDLGREDYDVPGYFEPWPGGRRWTYYRSRAEGHNTLVIDPDACEDQDPAARAVITRYESGDAGAFSIVDLTGAYRGVPVRRGVALADRSHVVVQDELAPAKPADVWWFLHTRADIALQDGGRTAVLSQNGQTMVARLQAPATGSFSVEDAAPVASSPHPDGNTPNTGVRKLTVHLTANGPTTIAVDLRPAAQPATGDAVTPLDSWHLSRTVRETVTRDPVVTTPSPNACRPSTTEAPPTTAAIGGSSSPAIGGGTAAVVAIPAFTG